MMTDTTIYGYYTDGDVVCTSCYDPDTDGRPGEEGVTPVYYLEDDGNGLSCGGCGEYIFEPTYSVEAVSDLVEAGISQWDSWDESDVPEGFALELLDGSTVEATVERITWLHYGWGYQVVDDDGAVYAVMFTPDHANNYEWSLAASA